VNLVKKPIQQTKLFDKSILRVGILWVGYILATSHDIEGESCFEEEGENILCGGDSQLTLHDHGSPLFTLS